jgi:hypothetical protein
MNVELTLAGLLCADAGTRAAAPFPAPLSSLAAVSLRCATDRFFLDEAEHFLQNRNASVATLRWCSGSSRNAVRLSFGISVRLRRNPQTRTLSRRRRARSTDTRVLEDACSWKCFLQLRRSDVFHALGVSRALQLGPRFSLPCGLKRTHGLDRIPPFLRCCGKLSSPLLAFVFRIRAFAA